MDNLIEFAKEQSVVFPEDSAMGWYLRETLKMLQAEPCEDAVNRDAIKLKIAGLPRYTDGKKIASIRHLKDFLEKELEAPIEVTQDMCVGFTMALESIRRYVNELPPVTPTQKWIPVSERLPKPYTYVNATCRSLVDDRENWVIETMYLPIPKENNEQGYSDWGNIPMLNWGKAEVVAWTERMIPEPYKESEEE